jgi:hypothetical protein
MIRCAKCGCSRLDSEKVGCVLCGGSPSFRTEPCHVNEDTKAKLLAHAEELKDFGVRLEVDRDQLKKRYTAEILAGIHLVIDITEKLYPGTLRKLVRYLWYIGISKEEMPRLRLDEPEKILAYYEGDKSGPQKRPPKRRRDEKSARTKRTPRSKSKGRKRKTQRRRK